MLKNKICKHGLSHTQGRRTNPRHLGKAFANDSLKQNFENKLIANEAKKVKRIIKSEYIIYPNPASNKLWILNKGASDNYVIVITDILGRKYYEQKNANNKKVNELDIDLPNGIYFVSILNNKKQNITGKLIISK